MTREEAAEILKANYPDKFYKASCEAYDVAIKALEAEPIKHGVIELTYEEYGELCSYALTDEPKHGAWIIDKSKSLMCSKCGVLLDEAQKPSRYCPNCGAKMDEVEE